MPPDGGGWLRRGPLELVAMTRPTEIERQSVDEPKAGARRLGGARSCEVDRNPPGARDARQGRAARGDARRRLSISDRASMAAAAREAGHFTVARKIKRSSPTA